MTQLEFHRRARGLSQTTLGEAILYSASAISRLETGSIPPEAVHPRFRHALESFFSLPLKTCCPRLRHPLVKERTMRGLHGLRKRRDVSQDDLWKAFSRERFPDRSTEPECVQVIVDRTMRRVRFQATSGRDRCWED